MTRLLPALLLALAFAASGCDSAAPSAEADAFGGPYGSFCNDEYRIAGPNSLSPNQSATYTVTAEREGCPITDVDWNVGFGGTLVSSSGASAVIQAGPSSGTIWMEALVTYVDGQVLALTDAQRAVSVQ